MRIRLALLHAANEARMGLGINMDAGDHVGSMLRDCMADVESISRVPGDLLSTLTPNLKVGVR
jgi:hypothetical protein